MKNKMKNKTKDMKNMSDSYNKRKDGCSCESNEYDESNCGGGRRTK